VLLLLASPWERAARRPRPLPSLLPPTHAAAADPACPPPHHLPSGCRHLEEQARKRAEEERERAAQRGQRRDYRAGQMSAEEKVRAALAGRR
jgi:hypothetical protein